VSKVIAVDLGSSLTRIFVRGKGVVLEEPSVIAIEKESGKAVAAGTDAILTANRIPGAFDIVHPLKKGIQENYNMACALLAYLFKKAGISSIRPRTLIVVPCGMSPEDESALCEACAKIGIKKLNTIEQPYASAIGYGIDVSLPSANIIADIGASASDIAVVALGGIEVSGSSRIAGYYFDQSLISFFEEIYSLRIEQKEAEELRKKYGAVYDYNDSRAISVHGIGLADGLPKIIRIESVELCGPLYDAGEGLVKSINSVIERTHHDSIADIEKNGVILTGGACTVRGLDVMIEDITGIKTFIAKNPAGCAIDGAGKALDMLIDIPDKVINISRIRE